MLLTGCWKCHPPVEDPTSIFSELFSESQERILISCNFISQRVGWNYANYFLVCSASCRLRASNAPWFMCWFQHYINCLCVYWTSFLPFFLLYFLLALCFLPYLFTSLLVCFLTYLSIPSRIDPFCFQARGRRRRPNLALDFWVHYYVVW